MPDSSVLLVPVSLDAMVVTTQANALPFRRWAPRFANLAQFQSPEPSPFGILSGSNFAEDPRNVGVHLMWTLPRALRTSAGDPPVFPLVPNRWLVVRRHGGDTRTATAWVVESDTRVRGDGFLLEGDTPSWTGIGVARSLAGWRESATQTPFLRAYNPGNTLLTAYQPHQVNVFSFCDTIGADLPSGQLSYTVIGWYARPSDDPLAAFLASSAADKSLDAFLAAQGWTLDAPAASASACLFHGAEIGVEWNRAGPTPSSRPDPATISVSIGSTADEAMAPLALASINSVLAAQGRPILTAADGEALLAAVLHNLQHGENDPSFNTHLEDSRHESRFSVGLSGVVWSILPGQGQTSTEDALTDAELAALERLNDAQQVLEAELRELRTLQIDLVERWWMQGYGTASLDDLPGFDAAAYARALSAAVPASMAAGVVAQSTVATNAQQARDTAKAAVDSLVGASGRMLSWENAPRFRSPAEPALVLHGVNGGTPVERDPPSACRVAADAVGAIACAAVAGGQITAAAGPIPDLSALPYAQACAALLAESFLLDPASAPAIARVLAAPAAAVAAAILRPQATAGRLPAAGVVGTWAQPWLPLYLEWEAEWTSYPLRQAGAPQWSFDGHDYRLDSHAQPSGTSVLGGRAFLGDGISSVLLDAMTKAARETGKEIPDLPHAGDYLSVALDGVNDLLSGSQTLPNQVPPKSQAALYGTTLSVPQVAPAGDTPDFEGVRAGRMILRRMQVVDRFGQSVRLADGGLAPSRVVTAVAVQPTAPTATATAAEVAAEFPPRFLAGGRLDFDFHDDDDGTPLVGWVLANHFDVSLTVYTPAGVAAGILAQARDRTGAFTVRWTPLGGPDGTTVAIDGTPLKSFVDGLSAKGQAGLADMLTAIDRAYWTIHPSAAVDDYYLAAMAGRPLALVRAALKLSLDETPLGQPAWDLTKSRKAAACAGYDFPVRLGDPDDREDGLIGVFLGDDFASLQVPPDLQQGLDSGYVVGREGQESVALRVSTPTLPGTATLVTLLMDPRGAVCACSGLLPPKRVFLERRWVDDAMAAMDLPMPTMPLLAAWGVGDARDGAEARPVLMVPMPPGGANAWTWSERLPADGQWRHFDLATTDDRARSAAVRPTLRDGLLRLKGGFSAPSNSNG